MGRTEIISNPDAVKDIILSSHVCHVGMITEQGVPYVIPMNFGYDDGIVYLHSANEGKHISALMNSPAVCITFITQGKLRYQHPDMACSYSMKAKSVLVNGDVEFIDSPDKKREALNIIMQHYTGRKDFAYSLPSLLNTKVWKVIPKETTAKSFGNNFKNDE